MSITRWDPFGDMMSLRDAMERLFAESVVRPQATNSGGSGSGTSSLALDVHEQGDDYVVSAPIPGVNPDDVDITVRGDMLRIRGERREQHQEGGENKRYLMREQRFGSFERVIQLPSAVKADGAKADFKNGVLTITLPKSEESKERRIPVQGGQQSGKAQEVPIESQSSSGSSNQKSNGTQASGSGQQSGGQQTMSSQQSSGGQSGSSHHTSGGSTSGDGSGSQNKTNGTEAMAGAGSGSKKTS
jgi:HSP20 family protein